MSNRLLTGSCLCGVVRYEVEDAFLYAAFCHCSQCRRATGAASKPFAGIEGDKLRRTTGDDELLFWGDPAGNHDVHCRRCGSFLYSIVGPERRAHVVMGTLVDAPSIRPDHHIMVGSKAAWDSITDGLPQYVEFSNGPRIEAE